MKTIGVIGLGSIGSRHARNLIGLGHKVIGYDPVVQQLDGIEMMHHPTNIGHGGYDGVVIASPTREHAYHLKIAADYGINTFVEKPIMDRFGLNDDELKRLHDPCNTMVGYNLRLHGCVKVVKDWMPLVGKPIRAQFDLLQYNAKPPYLRDGVILNWSHEIDLALYLLGPAIVKSSRTHLTNGYDDETWMRLVHDSGCRTEVHLDYITDPEVRKFTIVGYDGIITCDLAGRSCWITYDDGTEATFQGTDTWDSNYVEEMQAFIDRIDSKQTIGCTGAEGLEVLKICLEVRKQAGLK